MSVCLNCRGVNTRSRGGSGKDNLILAEEFLAVFKKADEDDDAGAGKAQKEHAFQSVHEEAEDDHSFDCSAIGEGGLGRRGVAGWSDGWPGLGTAGGWLRRDEFPST